MQHLTPDALRSPRLLRHANGARALRGAVIATRGDPAVLLERYLAFGGTPDARPCVVRFGAGAVEIRGAADLPAALHGDWPAKSWFAALRMEFDDVGAFVAAVQQEGVPVAPFDGGLAVDLRGPLGCVVLAEGKRA